MTQGCTTVDKTDENSLQRIEFDLNKQHVNIHDVGLISDIAIVNLANEEVILGEINKVIKNMIEFIYWTRIKLTLFSSMIIREIL